MNKQYIKWKISRCISMDVNAENLLEIQFNVFKIYYIHFYGFIFNVIK